jgi:hypothetical protein
MSDQFFYVQLKFTPKAGTHTAPITQHKAVVEVPKDLVQRNQSELIDENLRAVIALDLARRAALSTFPTVAERIIGLYDEHPPTLVYGSASRHERAALRSRRKWHQGVEDRLRNSERGVMLGLCTLLGTSSTSRAHVVTFGAR